MENVSALLIITGLLILAAEFVNGWTDAPNAIATVISTRVLSPRMAVLLATLLNFIGTLVGIEVAKTIGKGIVVPESITLVAVAAAMVSIVIWSSVAARFGLPTSESHALIAGLSGSALASSGFSALQWEGWKKVIAGLGFSTFLGFFGALMIMILMYLLFRNVLPSRMTMASKILQFFAFGFMAFSHGTNDGQKFIGVFALSLLLAGVYTEFTVDLWVQVVAAGAMGLGTAFGGWRIIRTMGGKLTNLTVTQGFAAQLSAGSVIQAASYFGIPLSTTHTINTSIMGVAAARRISAVRWPIALQIVMAWILTFPVCGALSFALTALALLFFS